ncbi:MAG: PQQ-binding-like beta-propeller repeat protein [Planctomycetales bacterium]|nr:PQQ-binding-like beta-propeller repeat protein [Planctomycetales bacterium]
MPKFYFRPISVITGLSVVVFICLSGATRADNWPQWRGPAGTGIADEVGLPTEWSESKGIVWKAATPAWGCSTPTIWNDAIFLTSQTDDGKLLALRLNATDGKTVWTTEIGQADTRREAEKRSVQKFHKLHNNASPSPVTDGRTVVVHFGNGDLAALDFAGKMLWKRNLQDDYGPYSIWWGHANSPVLFGDTDADRIVISVCMQDTLEGAASAEAGTTKKALSYVVAHELATGKVRWYTPRTTVAQAEECDSYTTPVFRKAADGTTEMIIMGGNQLDAYDPATGKLRWFLGGLIGGRTITGPVVVSDHVYTTRGMRGELLSVRLADASAGGKELATEAVLFRHKESTPDSVTPLVLNGRIYTVTDNGIAQCLDAKTGAELWKERMPGDYKASPIAASGKIYFLNKAGLCTVLADGPELNKVSENQLDEETLASPAAAGGRIYIRGREFLYCLGK